ncbi:bel1-like homeodomain protein 4 [Phtheirospermum japonicum]|uniref:Bel1-like homeodomain protein 4 n=1 Tax=Phtheirospermum japonicum TaxID=374723 RepID=A0A830DA91_9LAMI|nr:bel1-like homeodomain protein 4 [Phtheirospermum japonicum]
MQLFPPNSTSSTLNVLLPNPPPPSTPPGGHFGQFTWFPTENNHHPSNNTEIPGSVVEGQQQRLSLSLSPSLQQLAGGGGGGVTHSRQWSNILRDSKYAKAAQELLEEFCSVGRGQFRKIKPNYEPSGGAGEGNAASSSSSKDRHSLSASDRLEHQRRKVKLLSMLDEVDRRYNHYCEQMQIVVNSFEMIMGFGAATPYTTLAHKAMSRHFRCLKEALTAQLKQSCELLGEKDAGKLGPTKGETPRLRVLERSLRQQRVYHQMGMMEQEAWRPQRGLPERSVNALRAWLFEHFLNPYPSDADKQILARQTGLSRNQVSNWFINARVRLWKPMVEEMYQQEANEETEDQERDHTSSTTSTSPTAQIPTPPPTTTSATTSFTPPPANRPEIISAHENDPSFRSINAHYFSENHPDNSVTLPAATSSAGAHSFPADMWRRHPNNRFGTSGGDVSLTLGLRHDAGNLPDNNPFSVRDFDGC